VSGYAGTQAHDLGSGRQIWGDDRIIALSSTTYDGVYVATESDDVVARELRTGRELWRYAAGADASHVLAAAEGVVAVGSSVTATLLDAATGGQLWTASHSVLGLLIIGDTLALLVDLGGRAAVRALDLATGEARWELPEAMYFGPDALIAADGIVYFRPSEGPTGAYDARSGEQRWVYDGDRGRREPVAARGRDLYLFDPLQGGRIQAVRIP